MATITAETANGTQTLKPLKARSWYWQSKMRIDILHRCGGNARCTTCRVEILEGAPELMQDLERNRLALEAELADNVRLSCQIHVQNDLKVRVINQSSTSGMPAGPRTLDE